MMPDMPAQPEAALQLLASIDAGIRELNKHFANFLEAEVRSAAPAHELADKMGFAPVPGPCPKCSAPMKLRNGSRGSFYGCTRYSEGCRGTRDCK